MFPSFCNGYASTKTETKALAKCAAGCPWTDKLANARVQGTLLNDIADQRSSATMGRKLARLAWRDRCDAKERQPKTDMDMLTLSLAYPHFKHRAPG